MKKFPADEIASDNTKLEQKVGQEVSNELARMSQDGNAFQIGTLVKVDTEEAETSDPESLNPSICALLVKVDGGEGAIRGSNGFYLRTGPGEGHGYVIIIIDSGQICVLFGKPS